MITGGDRINDPTSRQLGDKEARHVANTPRPTEECGFPTLPPEELCQSVIRPELRVAEAAAFEQLPAIGLGSPIEREQRCLRQRAQLLVEQHGTGTERADADSRDRGMASIGQCLTTSGEYFGVPFER